MRAVIPERLYTSPRPGYSGAGNTPVGMGEVQLWIETAQAFSIASIICLLDEEHLRLYPDEDLPGICRAAGFEVRHVPVVDHRFPPLDAEQLAAVLHAWRELPKPVLIHCSAGTDRTGAAVRHIITHSAPDDTDPTP